MKSLAGAIVILAGSLLWGTAVLATSWIYATQGNIGTAQMAICGAVAIIIFGCGMVVAAARD
jgi:hypothetical protein